MKRMMKWWALDNVTYHLSTILGVLCALCTCCSCEVVGMRNGKHAYFYGNRRNCKISNHSNHCLLRRLVTNHRYRPNRERPSLDLAAFLVHKPGMGAGLLHFYWKKQQLRTSEQPKCLTFQQAVNWGTLECLHIDYDTRIMLRREHKLETTARSHFATSCASLVKPCWTIPRTFLRPFGFRLLWCECPLFSCAFYNQNRDDGLPIFCDETLKQIVKLSAEMEKKITRTSFKSLACKCVKGSKKFCLTLSSSAYLTSAISWRASPISIKVRAKYKA